jgi:hypothetical protein
MNAEATVTVETSLAALSEALAKASIDLAAVRVTLDLARANIAARNTSLARDVVSDAEKAIVHMRETDEALSHVLKKLHERD